MTNAVTIVEQDAQSWVDSHPDWTLNGDALQASYAFKDFVSAFSFLTRVAMIAEEQNHHPKIENEYNKVVLTLSTHDAGNKVTQKDFDLAEKIEALHE